MVSPRWLAELLIHNQGVDPVDSIADQAAHIHELVDVAAKDLGTYRHAEDDPNRRAAGMAALRSIDAAARALQTMRAALANELCQFDQPAYAERRINTAGNGGPGF
jgi:uncharacterized phage protein gp47/JayE